MMAPVDGPQRRLPGTWLLRLARVLFDSAVVTDVIRPTVADLQEEFLAAGSSRVARMRASLRGYLAFWSIVVMAPVALRAWPGQKKQVHTLWRATVIAGAAVVFIIAVDAARWQPYVDIALGGLVDWLGETGALGALGAARGLAFLAGPVALVLVGVRRWTTGGPSVFRLGGTEALVLSLLSVTAAVALGVANLIDVFVTIARSGTGGVATVSRGISGATEPVLLGLLTLGGCALVSVLLSLRPRAVDAAPVSPADPSTPPRSVRGLSMLLILALVWLDQLLRLHHAMTDWLLHLLTGGAGEVMGGPTESPLSLLLLGSTAMTVALLVVAASFWRTSRTTTTPQVAAWVSRVAAVMVIVGVAWHAGVLTTDLEALREVARPR